MFLILRNIVEQYIGKSFCSFSSFFEVNSFFFSTCYSFVILVILFICSSPWKILKSQIINNLKKNFFFWNYYKKDLPQSKSVPVIHLYSCQNVTFCKYASPFRVSFAFLIEYLFFFP